MKTYFRNSRSGIHSYAFAMILLALYELFKYLFQGQGLRWENAVDAWFQYFINYIPYGSWIVSLLVFLIGLLLIYKDRKKGVHFQFQYLFFMFMESIGWALLTYYTLPIATNYLFRSIAIGNRIGDHAVAAQLTKKSPSLMQEIGLSLGAGFYEELFFRLILIYLFLLLFKILGANTKHPLPIFFIALLSATLFSLAHYIGPYGDQFELYSFVFRILFGLVMNGLLVLRGFGITAWTHAWYDIFVFTIRAFTLG